MNKICLGILILSLAACSFKKDDATPKQAEQQAAPDVIQTISEEQEKQANQGILTEKNVSVVFSEHENPNSYRMIVSWPKSIRKVSLQVNDELESIVINTSRYEVTVNDDTEFTVTLKSFDQFGSPISTYQVKAKSPDDVVVSSTMRLNQHTVLNINRLFISEQGQIITHGFNLSITANKIYIAPKNTERDIFWRTSHILTNTHGAIAKSQAELNGSSISINAKQGQGVLRVALVGFDGKNGRSGQELLLEGVVPIPDLSSLNGPNGVDGKQGIRGKICRPRTDEPCERGPTCIALPTSGANGKPGFKGINGEDGWNGGNTGNLSVFVEDSKDFALEVGKIRGKPGKGGAGGEGTPGGLGGRAGTNPGFPCENASNGQPGPQGPRGDNGRDGQLGAEGTIATSPMMLVIKDL